MYEVIATESHIWIVTELCLGGELFDYLVEKGRLSEHETKIIFGQLCLAVAYLHDKGIVHRDLKLENVLLDEHCRVKLGDFGFTREFDRSSLMETFCGTTGYASPEMLQGKKYQGPEVDVWSLGVILYCLLTGTLPFDDDDEDIMRDKIIQGNFDDPEWLSLEVRDLLKNILVKDVTKRFTIPQILSHSWFTTPRLTYEPESPLSALPLQSDRPSTPDGVSQSHPPSTPPGSSEASTQASTSPLMNQPSLGSSRPTTPDQSEVDPFESSINPSSASISIHRNGSSSTIRKASGSDLESLSSKLVKTHEQQPDTVMEDEEPLRSHAPSPLIWTNSGGSKAPPSLPIRTPLRTKRRSLNSVASLNLMEDSGSPTIEKTPTPRPLVTAQDLDFATLLTATTPIIFSTPAERHLLNSLAALGFETSQIVHSVLSDACDAAGAIWWLLKKKTERMMLEDPERFVTVTSPTEIDEHPRSKLLERKLGEDLSQGKHEKKRRSKVNVGVQTEPTSPVQVVHMSVQAPKFAFVPPTPTFIRPKTPPRQGSPSRSPMLSPSSSTIGGDISGRSNPSTPSGSMKDKDRDKDGNRKKPRAGSVSIMQRATTALEAAGLVRKKSSEAVKEDREREKERERSRDLERRVASGDEPRSSHGSGGSSKLTKSPPLKPSKGPPTTPPPTESHSHAHMGSPWVLAEGNEALGHSVSDKNAIPPFNPRGEMLHSHSTPNFTENGASSSTSGNKPGTGAMRNRAGLLAAFRLWFNEDRKGKRKETDANNSNASTSSPGFTRSGSGSIRRGGSQFGMRGNHRAQRPSISSRRSSSVNSKRSSGTSAHQMIVPLDSPQIPGPRRSFGSHTPNSERGDHSSRPSSIKSFSMQQPRHRKSPSQSSAGSIHLRTASPSMQKYHRRGGSGSSTRVVRTPVQRPPHVRSNSAASSIHSPASSRPTSWYEPSDAEAPRTTSPFKTRSRRSTDDSSSSRRGGGGSSNATFVAQKRPGPFASPAYTGSLSRSSWKKSWGLEPPGWQSRTAHLPIEVLAISTPNETTSIRDVISGRQSISAAGDDSDWVDEDDDTPAFAGGLGQLGTSIAAFGSGATSASGGGGVGSKNLNESSSKNSTITLSPAPRGHRTSSSKRNANRNTGTSSGVGPARQKAGSHSPAERTAPLPAETGYEQAEGRTGRRQLPVTRPGPAFKQPIQEEDEEEEEE
ncbi:hypothetical protein BJ165DRAFT_1415679 [Panaeolus papilionaceus]|nr:hypothetical protein BJ165DRAFT_1415679 [Panaeolus papilionaceus]